MFKQKFVLLLSCCSFWQPAHALKKLPIADQQTSVITIAQKEFTRLTIKDDRIKQIFGGTQDLTIEVDEEIGQIFIKPLESRSRQIRMTLITEAGLTHDLKLIPRLQDSESILFVAGQTSAETPNHHQPERIEAILIMIKKLASNSNPKNSAAHEERNYQGLSHTLTRSHQQDIYHGYHYELTNTSDQHMTLDEETLYLPGDIALSLSKTYLEPGESTSFYVITVQEDEVANSIH